MSTIYEPVTKDNIDEHFVYVSKKEWMTLSLCAKFELIALSRMTGEAITDELNDDEAEIYNALMYGDDEE